MNHRILQGCVFDRLPEIEPGSIDCATTSPPYWMLRSYLPKGHALKHLELGSEKTPAEYVANQVRVASLVREALADHGTYFINVGDTYSHARGKRKPGDKHGPKQTTNEGSIGTFSPTADGIEDGSLCLIPQRLMIALADDGWIVRSIIVWHKPAPMPASIAGWRWMKCRVKTGKRLPGGRPQDTNHPDNTGLHGGTGALPEWQDCPGCKKCAPSAGLVLRRGSWRPTSSYEPILMLAKTADYFADGEPNKTPASAATVSRDQYTRVLDDPDEQFAVRHDHESLCDAGANARDVQRWAAEPLSEKHYAAYPTALVQWCLRAGTSAKGYCPMCGKPWVRILEPATGGTIGNGSWVNHDADAEAGISSTPGKNHHDKGDYQSGKTIGWRPSCRCIGADTVDPRPGRVLDPFAGSGRTGIACSRLGLDFTGIELNPDYAKMAERLIREESPLFATASE